MFAGQGNEEKPAKETKREQLMKRRTTSFKEKKNFKHFNRENGQLGK